VARDRLTETSIVKLAPKDAAALFVARNGGEGLNADEELVLANWLKKNVAHRQEYENAEAVWKTFINISGDEIQAAMRAHAATERTKRFFTWRMAAVTGWIVLLGVVATALLVPALKTKTVTVIPYTTLRSQLKEEQLPDGSQLNLDSDSIAVARFGPVGRQVQLQKGRALFSVAADRARTFAVVAGGRSILAVGTRFDVNLLNGGLIVTLLEGHLVIESTQTPPATPIVLEAGQQFVERGGQAVVRLLGADAEDAVAWRSGVAIFADQPLAEAAQIMNRYTKDEVVIKDPTVASLRVSGRFRTNDMAGFVAAIASAQSLQAVRTGQQIELIRP